MSACLVASFVGPLAQWGRTNFVLPHWASRPSPVSTCPPGHKRGFLGPGCPKRNLRAGYRAPSRIFLPSGHPQTYFSSSCVVSRAPLSLRMRAFDVRASSSPLATPVACAKFRFWRALHCSASPRRRIAYSLSLSDSPGTEAFTSEYTYYSL